jgi:sn-glycerol 3-phosphate transport system permease protein
MSGRKLVHSGLLVLACAAAAAWVLPYAWMVLTSFKTLSEIMRDPLSPLPAHLDTTAYREVFAAISVGRYMGVTIFMALAIAGAQIALALPAGYALAKLRFVGRPFAFGVVLACLLVPAQATFVPVFLMFAKARLVDTMTALVLPFAASALGTFLVRQALASVPDEIIEAARMDGASEWTIVYRVLAPMLKPTLVSLFLVSFVFHYNDYFWPLVMTTDDSVRTLPLGVALLREQGTGMRWHIIMAGNVVLSLPVLALFAAVQKHLVLAVTPPAARPAAGETSAPGGA